MLMKVKTLEIPKGYKTDKKILDISDNELRKFDIRINERIRKEVEENEQRNWEGLQAIKNIRHKCATTEKERDL